MMEREARASASGEATREDEQDRLARKLKDAREYLGLSQEFVADQLGIPRAAISQIETGKRKVAGLELKQLARLYRRSYEYFLGGDELPDEDEVIATALFRATKELSGADKEQVLRFAQFLHQAGSGPRDLPSGD